LRTVTIAAPHFPRNRARRVGRQSQCNRSVRRCPGYARISSRASSTSSITARAHPGKVRSPYAANASPSPSWVRTCSRLRTAAALGRPNVFQSFRSPSGTRGQGLSDLPWWKVVRWAFELWFVTGCVLHGSGPQGGARGVSRCGRLRQAIVQAATLCFWCTSRALGSTSYRTHDRPALPPICYCHNTISQRHNSHMYDDILCVFV
jgi:hypothetical protein